MVKHQQVSALLDALQLAMAEAGIWSATPPSERAMASTAPFACDTMSFENWLQFIFIAKMQQLIKSKAPLPQAMVLLPMAEECLVQTPALESVLPVIARIDEVFGGE